MCRHHHKSSDCFEYLKISSLNQATQKILPKFFYLTKSCNRKFETHKNPIITSVIWNTEYPTGHFAICVNAWNRLIPEIFLHSQFPEFQHKVQENCINKIVAQSIWHHGPDVATRELLLIYIACIRSILEYSSPIFHRTLPSYLSQDLERLQKFAMKINYPELSYAKALELSSLLTHF